MRVLVRTSKWAVWSRRLGSFALPLTVVPVLMHRAEAMTTIAFEVVEVLAIVVSLLALLVTIGAFARIWVTGDQGWGRAVAGLLLSLLCLAPIGLLAADFVLYPMTDEVSTDATDPPPLVSDIRPVAATAATQQRIAAAFPNVRTRNYPLGPAEVFNIVNNLVADRGWDVLLNDAPDETGQGGQINALAITLFGFRDEVSIRLAATADGTSVAMRSVSLSSLHEPGVNGSRIEGFLTALDDKITALQKDQPAGASDDSEDETDQPPIPAPAPPPRGKRH